MGFPAYWASQALALTQAGAMVGRVGWGIVSDRLFGGRRKIVLILIGLLSATSIMALGFLGANHRCICYYRFFFWRACAWSAIKEYPTRSLLAGKAKTGSVLGMMITINAAFATLGTPLFGYIVDQTGSYPIAWMLLATALGVGVLGLATLLTEPREAG